MLFQSQIFLIAFLPVVLGAFFLLRRRLVGREWMLILASAVFYGFWDVRFLPLLFGQAVATWLLVRLIGKGGGTAPGFLLPVGIGLNLGILALFKYADFAVATLEAATGTALPRSGLVLPIGISFYTFQIVSYLIDFQAGRAPVYGLRRFVLYVTFFPQLVAGPIVRHDEFMPQLDRDPMRPGLSERVGRGATLFCVGLAKKVFIADALAPYADAAFALATTQTPALGTAWSGALAFSLQLFFDFAAYSEMALGLALVMGIRLPVNFDVPYGARNLQEFWRRWHMTLSRFLRDYVYIPLGGSRQGWTGTALATMATMGLCGLWHGAGWTFVAWGLLHGVGLIACRMWTRVGPPMPFFAAWAVTMGFVLVGWVLFRAADFEAAGAMLGGLVGAGGLDDGAGWPAIGLAAILSVVPMASARYLLNDLRPHRMLAACVAIGLVVAVIAVGDSRPEPFIYFQF